VSSPRQVELMLLMEEAGLAAPLPGPFFSTVVLAGSVLEARSLPEQKNISRPSARESSCDRAILEASALEPEECPVSEAN